MRYRPDTVASCGRRALSGSAEHDAVSAAGKGATGLGELVGRDSLLCDTQRGRRTDIELRLDRSAGTMRTSRLSALASGPPTLGSAPGGDIAQ
jgi:hypothetical protein